MIIGYIFQRADRWSTPAKAVVEDEEGNHSSDTVWSECFGTTRDGEGKCNTVMKEITHEFRRAIAKLNEGTLPQKVVDFAYGSRWRTRELLENIIKEHAGDCKELVDKLREASRWFEGECKKRKASLKKVVIVHRRHEPYRRLYDILEKSVRDPDDVEVILDAHFVGVKIRGIVLITGDKNDIASNEQVICDNTSIAEVKWLGDVRV